ncbi:MAG: GNAT family N-acetyltransferase [Clostridium sp.]|nr:GNAT family N-acetyltransferase [Clostridium sp.]
MGKNEVTFKIADIGDSKGIAKVHVDAWHETYNGIISDEYLNFLSYDEKSQKWEKIISDNNKYQKVFVIENEEQGIIGFGFCGVNEEKEYDYDADLHAIYILRAYQNLGYGSKLIKIAVKELMELGYKSLIVWALKGNSYCRFYEKLGGRKIKERPYQYGSQQVILIGYGFKDIKKFLS